MIRQDPILIASPPRCGTTMLAGLFYHHGVWVGKAKKTQYPGTNSDFGSENTKIKQMFKRHFRREGYNHWATPFPDFGRCEYMKKMIENIAPDDTPWLVKSSNILLFWKFWIDTYPNAKWVFPVRDPLKIMDSMRRHPGMARHPDKEKQQYIDHLLKATKDVVDAGVNHMFVDVEKLIDLDGELICELFDFIEIKPDFKIIREWIKPKMLKR